MSIGEQEGLKFYKQKRKRLKHVPYSVERKEKDNGHGGDGRNERCGEGETEKLREN